MSRIGKKPIPLPSGVKIQIGEQLEVTGPKGKLTVPIPDGITFEQADGKLEVKRASDEHAALHGLTRALAANAVQGVSTGFTRELDIVGIGYRADVKGKIATFTLGYSHPIEVLLPDGVDLKIDKQTHLVLSGYDRSCWARWRPTSARCASRIRTRTRASATRAKCCARRSVRPGRVPNDS